MNAASVKLSSRQSRGDGACKRFSWVLTAFGGLLCFPRSPNDWAKVLRLVLTVDNVKQRQANVGNVFLRSALHCSSCVLPVGWLAIDAGVDLCRSSEHVQKADLTGLHITHKRHAWNILAAHFPASENAISRRMCILSKSLNSKMCRSARMWRQLIHFLVRDKLEKGSQHDQHGNFWLNTAKLTCRSFFGNKNL